MVQLITEKMKEEFRSMLKNGDNLTEAKHKFLTKLGCEYIQKHKNGIPFVSVKGEKPAGYIGIELEVAKNTGSFTGRKIKRHLLEESNPLELSASELTRIRQSISRNFSTVAADVCANRIFNRSPLVYEVPHYDGGGRETVLVPISEGAYKLLYSEIEFIMDSYKNFGFSDELAGAGIHANIDFSLFGNTPPEQAESIKNFLWFLFRTKDIMFPFYRRKFATEWYADIEHLLQTESEDSVYLEKTFISIKDQVLEALGSNNKKVADSIHRSSSSAFNLTFNRDGRPAIEFRWFATTTDMNVFMSIIDYCFALTKYCSSGIKTEDVGIETFSQFIMSNAKDYSFFMEEIHKYDDIRPYFILGNKNVDIPEQLVPTAAPKKNALKLKTPVDAVKQNSKSIKRGQYA